MKRNVESDSVQRIVDAATEVFAEAGYAGARVDEIARRAGMNKATIYYHIGGKKELYDHVITGLLRESVERIIQKVEETSTPEEKLRQYIRALAENLNRKPAIVSIMLREIAQSGEHFSDSFIATIFRLMQTLMNIFDEGERQEVFSHTSPLLIHFMVIGAFTFFSVKEAVIAHNTRVTETLKLAEEYSSGKAEEGMRQFIERNISTSSGVNAITGEIEKLIIKAVMK